VEEIIVTRKYQITIPQKARSKLGIRIGDKLVIREEEGRIIFETPKRINDPSEFLWGLPKKPIDIDAAKLMEGSWRET